MLRAAAATAGSGTYSPLEENCGASADGRTIEACEAAGCGGDTLPGSRGGESDAEERRSEAGDDRRSSALIGEQGLDSGPLSEPPLSSVSLRLGEAHFSWPSPTIESMEKPIFGFEGSATIAVDAIGIIVRSVAALRIRLRLRWQSGSNGAVAGGALCGAMAAAAIEGESPQSRQTRVYRRTHITGNFFQLNSQWRTNHSIIKAKNREKFTSKMQVQNCCLSIRRKENFLKQLSSTDSRNRNRVNKRTNSDGTLLSY